MPLSTCTRLAPRSLIKSAPTDQALFRFYLHTGEEDGFLTLYCAQGPQIGKQLAFGATQWGKTAAPLAPSAPGWVEISALEVAALRHCWDLARGEL